MVGSAACPLLERGGVKRGQDSIANRRLTKFLGDTRKLRQGDPFAMATASPLAGHEASAVHDLIPSDKKAATIRPGITPLKPSVSERLPLCISGGIIHGRGVASTDFGWYGVGRNRSGKRRKSEQRFGVYFAGACVFEEWRREYCKTWVWVEAPSTKCMDNLVLRKEIQGRSFGSFIPVRSLI